MDDNQAKQPTLDETSDMEATTSANANVSVIQSLEELIKNQTTRLDLLKEELKKHRNMLDDVLNNDETYRAHEEKAKEATRLKTTTKQQLMKAPQVAEKSEKVKSMRQEMKDLEASLSDYLQEFHRLSGIQEIEGPDGELRQIIYVARLVKKSSKKRESGTD